MMNIKIEERLYNFKWTNDGGSFFEIIGTTRDGKIILNNCIDISQHIFITPEKLFSNYIAIEREN